MKNKETLLAFIFGLFTIVTWFFPSDTDIKVKIAVLIITVLSIGLIYLKEKLSFFFRQYWQEILSFLLVTMFGILFYSAYHQLLLPASILLLTSISISLLITFKYGQAHVFKFKSLVKQIHFNEPWNLNHWGSVCASIQGDQMLFKGTTAPKGTDGSHINLLNLLEIGNTYEIVCNAKSSSGTTGLFQLWCHDNTGEKIYGSNAATPYNTPSTKGDVIKLLFRADYNSNIRIHLQYTPGQGQIIISDVRVYKLGN